jgi:hypothetical protein
VESWAVAECRLDEPPSVEEGPQGVCLVWPHVQVMLTNQAARDLLAELQSCIAPKPDGRFEDGRRRLVRVPDLPQLVETLTSPENRQVPRLRWSRLTLPHWSPHLVLPVIGASLFVFYLIVR